MKKLILVIFAAIMIFTLACCKGNNNEAGAPGGDLPPSMSGVNEGYDWAVTDEQTNFVKIEMADGSIILVELYPDIAPITVANFKKLVSENFYDGLTFHRVIEGFMIQGGDPNGDGTGGSKETIKGEFAANGFNNTLKHERGVLSMARRSYPLDSARSQFFICHGPVWRLQQLDGQYAAFGRVIAGMDVVDRIAGVSTDSNDKPLSPQVMKVIEFITIKESVSSGDTAESQS